jgi:hypothetical protein
MPTQRRYDLEFQARMLGNLEVRTIGTADPLDPNRAQFGAYTDEALERAVAFASSDPIVNARARQRIGALYAELPGPRPLLN